MLEELLTLLVGLPILLKGLPILLEGLLISLERLLIQYLARQRIHPQQRSIRCYILQTLSPVI